MNRYVLINYGIKDDNLIPFWELEFEPSVYDDGEFFPDKGQIDSPLLEGLWDIQESKVVPSIVKHIDSETDFVVGQKVFVEEQKYGEGGTLDVIEKITYDGREDYYFDSLEGEELEEFIDKYGAAMKGLTVTVIHEPVFHMKSKRRILWSHQLKKLKS